MGWYDHEQEDWLPEWAVTPLMWIGCLLAAVLPAGLMLAVLSAAWAKPPGIVAGGVYLASVVLMTVTIKPWTVR